MRALSIRQPFAKLILRGLKEVEHRSRPTTLIGESVYIYAAKNGAKVSGVPYEGDMTSEELVKLPRGFIVGTAVITKCERTRDNGHYHWHLSDVTRLDHPRRPTRMPRPVWFKPF